MMRKLLIVTVLAIAAIASCTSCTTVQPKDTPRAIVDQETTLRLVTPYDGGLCSGTAVGANTFLSAAHCFSDSDKYVTINGVPAEIQKVLNDGNDHVLVIVDMTFKVWATFGPPVKQRDRIHYWGNPAGLNMFYREGYVTGTHGNDTMYDVNGFNGDSGTGVFDEQNRLVAVISYTYAIDRGTNIFQLMGSYPFNFTFDQLQYAGLMDPKDKWNHSTLVTGQKGSNKPQ